MSLIRFPDRTKCYWKMLSVCFCRYTLESILHHECINKHLNSHRKRPFFGPGRQKDKCDLSSMAEPVAPGAWYTVSRLNSSRRPGRQLSRYRAPPIMLTPA